jgi:ribosomal protein S18 acetylase RimI-like enzyme
MSYRLEHPPVERAAELAALKGDTFREAFAAENDPDQLEAHLARAFTVDAVAAELLDPRCDTTWVLDEQGPVGYLKVNVGTAQSEPGLSAGLEVEQLYVLASHRGEGLGGRLLDLAAAKATELGLTFVWLGVWERNTNAISVYQHRGYRQFDDHVFMFGEEAQRDVLMRLDLPTSTRTQRPAAA